MSQQKYATQEFSPAELDAFNNAIIEVCETHHAEIALKAVVEENGTLSARMIALKKVELVPKEGGAEAPTIIGRKVVGRKSKVLK